MSEIRELNKRIGGNVDLKELRELNERIEGIEGIE